MILKDRWIIYPSLCIVVALIVGVLFSRPYLKIIQEANTETTAVITDVGGKSVKGKKAVRPTKYTFTDNFGNKHIVYQHPTEVTLLAYLLYKDGQNVKLWYSAGNPYLWRTHYTDLGYGLIMTCIGLFTIGCTIALKKEIDILSKQKEKNDGEYW